MGKCYSILAMLRVFQTSLVGILNDRMPPVVVIRRNNYPKRDSGAPGCVWVTIILILCAKFCAVNSDPNCDFVAATNIHAIFGYNQWSCSSSGLPSTTPCSSPVWPGLICSGSTVVSINLKNIGLIGKFCLLVFLCFDICCFILLRYYSIDNFQFDWTQLFKFG